MHSRRHKKISHAGLWLVVAFTVFSHTRTSAQVIELGFKGGLNLTSFAYDDNNFRKVSKAQPILGFSVGPAVSFKVKDRYFLHTEYLYSTKGRVLKSDLDPQLRDKRVNHFIEIPVTYNIFFNGHFRLHGDKQFKYYAGAGPLFSYWLKGGGKIYSGEHADGIGETRYKVFFQARDTASATGSALPEEVYLHKANRLQLGFVFGGGIMTEPDAKHRLMIDFRAEYGHSWQAKTEYEDYIIPKVLQMSAKGRSIGLRLSAMYMIEMNTNKKVRNKGKSNVTLKKYGHRKR